MKTKLFTLIFAFLLLNINAIEINVPADYATIQLAIENASNGDIIIVDNGTYYENISFLGKEILVTSNFHLTGNRSDIVNTIINGSRATGDLGSCVTFNSGETNNSILKGFTIREGTGTKTFNSNENLWFRTGGGLLLKDTSPTIINNIIEDNESIAETGVFAAGGGGIRMGNGQPIIMNNIIRNNTGGYAGGIMIGRFSTGSIIKNNVIANNTAIGSFNGGGGVFVDWQPVTLENNTIVNNHSGDKGGGVISTGTTTVIKNCIIYGNTATNGDAQIFKRFGGGNANVTYTNIEGGFNGAGNEEGIIDVAPNFADTAIYLLNAGSPCIDSGNPDTQYNDIEDPNSAGNALSPSLGTIANDMGAYGGQSVENPLIINDNNIINGIDFKYINPYKSEGIEIYSDRHTSLEFKVFDFNGKRISNTKLKINQGTNKIPLKINSNCILIFIENGNYKTIKLLKQ